MLLVTRGFQKSYITLVFHNVVQVSEFTELRVSLYFTFFN